MADGTAGERQRRRRQRRAAGAIGVRVEVQAELQARLALLGYLRTEHVGDRERVEAAVSEFLADLADGESVTP